MFSADITAHVSADITAHVSADITAHVSADITAHASGCIARLQQTEFDVFEKFITTLLLL